MRDAHKRAHSVGDHVQHEHGHGLLDHFRRQDAPSQVIVRHHHARRVGCQRLLHRCHKRLDDQAHAVELDAARRGAGAAAHAHERGDDQERARGQRRGQLVGGDVLEARGGERRHDEEHAAAHHGCQVREIRACRDRRGEHQGHHGDPDEHGADLHVAEVHVQVPLPQLGVQHEVHRPDDHEEHEHHFDGERMVVQDGRAHGREAAGAEAGNGQP